MAWVRRLQMFFREIEVPLSFVLNAEGCREGWVQAELFRRFRPRNRTFNVNCSLESRQAKHDIVSGTPPSLVAELKVYGLSGYYTKNLYGKSNVSAFHPSGDERVAYTREMIEALNPQPGSYLKDVLRLAQTVGVTERLMILVLQKAVTIDRFGQAMLAIQVSEREHDLDFGEFMVRISEI